MLDRLLFRLALWSAARPRRAIALMVLVVVASLPGLLRLELRTDGHALVPPDHPVVHFDAEVRQRFELRDPILVLIETTHPEGIYNIDTMRRVADLSRALGEIPGIGMRHITSLATEHRDRVFPGTLDFRRFLEPLPETPAQMDLLRQDVAAAEILYGTLVSPDETAVSVVVGTPPLSGAEEGVQQKREELYQAILETVSPFETETDRILVVGAPVAESLLGTHIIEDLTVLIPLSMALIAVILWLGCRRLWGVLTGMIEVGACIAWTFGLMGWLGFPVYLTTALLPVILTTMGLADEVHIFWHYQRKLEDRRLGPHPEAVAVTMRDMARPVFLTSVTTSLGLLSFLASSIAPVRTFGLFAALGILFCMLWSMTVIPAMLSCISPQKMRRPQGRSQGSSAGALGDRLSAWSAPLIRRPGWTVAALLLLSVLLGSGVFRLYVQDGWIEGFAPRSDFRQATAQVNRQLLGTHTLLAHLRFAASEGSTSAPQSGTEPDPRPLHRWEMVQAVGEFEDFLRQQPQAGGILGLHSQMKSVAFLWRGRQERGRNIPRSTAGIQRLFELYEDGRGLHRLREVVDEDYSRAIVSIYLKEANYQDTAALIDAVRSYEQEHLEPLGIQVDFAGDVAVSQAMIPAIVETQVLSLLLALAGALAAICLLYRSLRAGLFAILPASVALLWTFGLMGWLGIPLGVATSMFCAITLGIGVDYAIHFVERFRAARAAGRPAPVPSAMRWAGPAIVMDAAAVALGLGLLTVSQVPANARLGLLAAFALTAGCLLTLGGLGALLSLSQGGRAERGAVP